jgi:hypothetical protein
MNDLTKDSGSRLRSSMPTTVNTDSVSTHCRSRPISIVALTLYLKYSEKNHIELKILTVVVGLVYGEMKELSINQ